MPITTIILTIAGLCLFETVMSIDNAIINAEVLSTMQQRFRHWFLLWGLLIAVFLVRGFLPWLIVWFTTPGLGPLEAFNAAFSGDPKIKQAVESSAPVLLVGGGTFLVFLSVHWLFLEDKNLAFTAEKFFHSLGAWFYAVMSVFFAVVIWLAVKRNPVMAFSAATGAGVFFITHGFKSYAENAEKKLAGRALSDIGKVFYLEVIDASFSIDGVLGAFAFTLSVPLILIGNGLGAFVVRQLTVGNIDRIKRYIFLKNGAMYSILVLGFIMILDAFGWHIPEWLSPVATFAIVGFFFWKSKKHCRISPYANPR